MLRKLAEIANKLDSLKLYKEADKVDNVIKKMAQVYDEFDFPMVDTKPMNMESKSNIYNTFDMSGHHYDNLTDDANQYNFSSEPPEIEESKLKEAIANYINRLWHSEYIEGDSFEESSFKIYDAVKPEDLKLEWTNNFGDSSEPGLQYCWMVTFDDPSYDGLKLYKDSQMPIWIVNEYDYPPSAVQKVEGVGHDGNPKVFYLYGER